MRLVITTTALILAAHSAMAGIEDGFPHLHVFTGGDYDKETFRYQFLAPQSIEPGKTYPLILFLHGAGERGDDPEVLKKHFLPAIASDEFRKTFPCFVIAPQCRTGERWADRKSDDAKANEPTAMMQMALQCVDDVLGEFPVDKNRLYLTGLSMGGYGSWDLAARQADRWAAVVPICGGGDEANADKLKAVPIWVFHGDADKAVPVEASRGMVEAIRAAGGDPKYTEYPGVGHDSWTQTYADPDGVFKWMFEQRLDQRGK